MTIDSHQHFWKYNATEYGWMTDEHRVIRRDFMPDDLKPILDEAGVDGTIAVQARQLIEETDFLLTLAEDHTSIKGVVGWLPLCDAGVGKYLEKYAGIEKLVGVRHLVHDEPDDNFILRKDFNEGVELLKNHNLTYDVLIFEKHLPQAIQFVDMHPNQPMVVDHIAKPQIRGDKFDHTWATHMREMAKREHVYCKLSGMVTEVRDENWDLDLLMPYFDVVLEAFGPHRLMFGSDWPVCLLRSGYVKWLSTVQSMIATLSKDEKENIMGGNALRFYFHQNK